MQFIIGIILIYLAFIAVQWLIVNIIGPVGRWVLLGTVVIGLVIGCYVAIKSYIKAIAKNINPYNTYTDTSKKKQEYAKRRSYFFGPGFHQLICIVKDAWSGIRTSVRNIGDKREDIADWTEMIVVRQILWCFSWLFYLVALFTVGILGSAITLGLSLAHAAILILFMVIIYILFSITWLVDRIYLHNKAIRTSCPYCQARSVIPTFACPNCGSMHTRLVPGPYGIWHRHCTCGEKLPTTFLMGRSSLDSFCVGCGHELAASDVQQFSLSLVGGTSSGKTVLLSAFYHEFFRQLSVNINARYEIPDIHQSSFDDLEAWFSGVTCPATTRDETAQMYSVLIKSAAFDVDKQFSLYDLSGEAFNDPTLSDMLPQKQMRDSNGVVMVIDPLSAIRMRDEAAQEGDDTSNFSAADSASVISNFVTYLKTILVGQKARKKSDKPVAVVITKADLSSISRYISYLKIKMTMRANPELYPTFAQARDALCRTFLMDIGLSDAVLALESNFTEIHYFPVSAIGHNANGEEFEPEHVLEPFYWLIARSEPAIAELLGIDNAE